MKKVLGFLLNAILILFFIHAHAGEQHPKASIKINLPRADLSENITACDSVLLVEYQSGVCEANIVEVIKDTTQKYQVGQVYPVEQTLCEKSGYTLPDGLLACHSHGFPFADETHYIYDNRLGDANEPLAASLEKIRRQLGVKTPEKETIIAQQPKQEYGLLDDDTEHVETISWEEAAKEFNYYLENKDWNACDAVLLVRYDPDNCASGERIDRIFFDKTQQLAVGQPYPHETSGFCSSLRGSCDDENTIYNILFCHNAHNMKHSETYVNTINVKDNKMPFTDEPVEDFLTRVLNKKVDRQ